MQDILHIYDGFAGNK